MTSPAVCVEDGVLAMMRCEQCNRAVCAAHAAPRYDRYAPRLCTQCDHQEWAGERARLQANQKREADRERRLQALMADPERTWHTRLVPHLKARPQKPIYWPKARPIKQSSIGFLRRPLGDWKPGTVMAYGWLLGASLRVQKPANPTMWNEDVQHWQYPWWLCDGDLLVTTEEMAMGGRPTVRVSPKDGEPHLRRRLDLRMEPNFMNEGESLRLIYEGAFQALL